MQSIQSLRWDDLQLVLAISRAGSLKRAADMLNVNVSTVARRLDRLEEDLDVHLFDRTFDGALPTAVVEELLPFAEQMESAVNSATRTLEGQEHAPEGVVRLTAPPGLVDHFIAPALPDLYRAHPKIQLSLVSTIAYADLTRREADIALRGRLPQDGDLLAKRLVSHGYRPVAAPRYAKKLGRITCLDDARWVTWGDDLAHLPDRRFLDEDVSPNHVTLRTSNMTAQIEAVRAGLGAMIVPMPYATLRGLCLLTTTKTLAKRFAAIPNGELWLVGHRALRDVPRIDAVWRWLETLIR